MIFKKRDRWKVSGSSKKYATYEEAVAADPDISAAPPPPPPPSPLKPEVDVEVKESWSPLEKLRGWSDICVECSCDPCECDEIWKSVDET